MSGGVNRIGSRGRAIALGLLSFAFLVRALIPAGWMPSVGNGLSITLCTGMGAVQVWVDDEGNVRKDPPPSSAAKDQPCAFAGLAAPLIAPDAMGGALLAPVVTAAALLMRIAEVAVGRGLAAPPPPPTGPPAFA